MPDKQLPLILRAIITGFGYKLGSELGRWVVDRFKRKRKAGEPDETQDDLPEGLPKDPANPGAETDPPRVSPADRTN
jgi:hypothetical protein